MSASYVTQKHCVSCNKSGGVLTCDGCQQTFCGKHVVEHRQHLAFQLEGIMQEHDLIQQDLGQSMYKHPLLEQINHWEKESIRKIQMAAEKARADLRQLLESSNERLSRACRDIATKLCAAREADNFSEIELTRWMKQLNDIKSEISLPSTINILDDNTFAIHLIRIEDSRTENKSRKNKHSWPTSKSLLSIAQERFAEVNGLAIIDDEGLCVKHIDNDNRFVHLRGQQVYSEGRHTVRFKIEQSAGFHNIFIGVCTSKIGLRQILYHLTAVAGWFGNNEVWHHGKCNSNPKSHGYKSDDIKANDVLEFTLDCGKRQIELSHERTNKQHAITVDLDKTPFPWHILLALRRKGDCVRILPNS